eukprot:4872009-Pyramimonas_sp.AAC.1
MGAARRATGVLGKRIHLGLRTPFLIHWRYITPVFSCTVQHRAKHDSRRCKPERSPDRQGRRRRNPYTWRQYIPIHTSLFEHTFREGRRSGARSTINESMKQDNGYEVRTYGKSSGNA